MDSSTGAAQRERGGRPGAAGRHDDVRPHLTVGALRPLALTRSNEIINEALDHAAERDERLALVGHGAAERLGHEQLQGFTKSGSSRGDWKGSGQGGAGGEYALSCAHAAAKSLPLSASQRTAASARLDGLAQRGAAEGGVAVELLLGQDVVH